MIAVRVYIPGASIGDSSWCEDNLDPIYDTARSWNLGMDRPRCGVKVLVVETAEHAPSEFIDLAKADAVTGGRYPDLYVNVTYDPDRLEAETFVPFEEQFGLRPVYAWARPGALF
jgi:hypothetical protein